MQKGRGVFLRSRLIALRGAYVVPVSIVRDAEPGTQRDRSTSCLALFPLRPSNDRRLGGT
jgi:hypothetical protein